MLKKFLKTKYNIALVILLVLIACINVLACFPKFCDAYRNTVYHMVSGLIGRVSSVIPFVIGEILIYLAIIIGVASVIILALIVFVKKIRKFARIWFKALLMMGLVVGLIYTLNWVIPFRAPGIKVYPMSGASDDTENFTLEELRSLRAYLVEQINQTAKEVPRDKNGSVIYDSKNDLEKKVSSALVSKESDYSILGGFYPTIKEAYFSDFLEWMNIAGFTYPYTMEVTVNHYLTTLYQPFLYGHELLHHKGFFKESEANFLSFYACKDSDDPVVRYSAYLYAYLYVEEAYVSSFDFSELDEIMKHEPRISSQVIKDYNDSYDAYKAEYNSKKHPASNLKKEIESVAESGWKIQDRILDSDNYDGMVMLLLRWYR